MTIKRGESWGDRRVPPADLAEAGSDAQSVALIDTGTREFLLTGGDMWRTIGGSSASHPTPDGERTVVIVDSLVATFHQGSIEHRRPVLSHAVFVAPSVQKSRKPWWRSWTDAKDRTYVMNAQFLGDWDLAPRGHPNDGRFEVLTVPASMPWRQRQLFRRRVVTGTHIPHPLIETRSVSGDWSPGGAGHLTLDGQVIGEVDDLTVSMVPDSLTVWI